MYVTSCQEEDEDDFRCAEVMGDEQLDFDLFCEHTLMVGLRSCDVSRRDGTYVRVPGITCVTDD
jgi:hypothetical protein